MDYSLTKTIQAVMPTRVSDYNAFEVASQMTKPVNILFVERVMNVVLLLKPRARIAVTVNSICKLL